MASNYGTQPAPMQYPPPRRSFAGPIILILIGLMFLLGNLHVIPWRSLGHYFARWWPVFIILWGVIKLIEYALAQRQNRRTVTFGAGGIVFLVFLIVIGLVASGVDRVANTVNWGELGDRGVFGEVFGQAYTFNQELQQDFPAGGSLKVVSERGAITVDPWDQNRIKVVVTKKLRATDQADADKADTATRALISVSGSEVLLNANTIGAGNRAVESDMIIYLPRKAMISVATRQGDVSISGRTGDVQVSNSHGDVNLNDLSGDVTVSLRQGSLKIVKVTGNVVVDGRLNEVTVADVTGSVRVNGDVMDGLTLAHVARQVTYRSSRTDLEFASLPGELTMQSGDIKAKQMTGPVRLTTRSKDIHIDDVSGDVHIENSNGILEVHTAKLPLGSLQLSNRNADIRVVLPARAAFQLDASTRRGDITSDFGGINVSTSRGESRAAGSVGSGGPRLEINNEHGDVEIRKAG
jgi:DUF4097 and DUF4098 domain-containing protein YvlB